MATMMAVALPIIAGGLQVGGMVMQARASEQAGTDAKNMANAEATQLRQNANNEMGQASEQVASQEKETKTALSNAAAAAAGSGGAVTDPSTQNIMSTIAGQGRLRSLTDLYNGQSAAQQTNLQADMTAAGGYQAAEAGKVKAYSTVLGGASTLFDKYADPKFWSK